MAIVNTARKALKYNEIAQAVQHNIPVGPDSDFFVEFSDLRGDFNEKIVLEALNVELIDGVANFDADLYSDQKKILFLGGMRGSGKTTELAKLSKILSIPSCFFCVTCNTDQELDMNDVDYVDILILQMQKLSTSLQSKGLKLNKEPIKRMELWFAERDHEARTELKIGSGLDFGVKGGTGEGATGLLGPLVSVLGSLMAGISGSKEWLGSVRKTIRNNFGDFASIFNAFVIEANIALRKQKLGQEVLFIVDGLEKTMEAELRRKILLDDSNRLQQVKAYSLFTLPIELMKERLKLGQYSQIESFPFVKVTNRDGTVHERALERFREFVYKRIDEQLFENEEIVNEMILLSGGSPRQLLQIIEKSKQLSDNRIGKITNEAFQEAKRRLVNDASRYLTTEKIDCLKQLKEAVSQGRKVTFEPVLEELLEDLIVMEYNDGNYKRVNPLIEVSEIYQQEVLGIDPK